MSTALTPMEQAVFGIETSFVQVNQYGLNFKKEANFALQLLKAGDFLRSVAQGNPDSLKNALTNIAAIGISLNPATKEAYLVPRKGAICLDISAIGLIKLATDSGSIKWAQAELVRKNDKFEFNGVGKEPTHTMDPFSDRGEIVGVYAVAKTCDGDSLVTIMSVKECHEIRDRSDAWISFKAGKTKSCPWSTDEGEMCKKTVIKRASKLWPKSERLDSAVHALNEHEGIDFSKEKSPFMAEAPTTEIPNENTFNNLRALLAAKNRTEDALLVHISKQCGLTEDNYIKRIEDMNSAQVQRAYSLIASAK